MRIAAFCHSLLSDWNRGTAHFLRGILTELVARGHAVEIYEPRDPWSVASLVREHTTPMLSEVRAVYPDLAITRYDVPTIDLDATLDGVDLVLVHDSTPRDLVARIGAHRARHRSYTLLFHDTRHRSVTEPSIDAHEQASYDGVLASAETIRECYLARGWSRRVWTWHKAADTRVFQPPRDGDTASEGDVVFIGNWGDDRRVDELEAMFVGPVRDLGLSAQIHGIRYPAAARATLAAAGVRDGGWLPNFRMPSVFARYTATVHLPRRPSLEGIAGLPTMRAFEAMACGICLVSSPWTDREELFTPGSDYLVARTREEMTEHLRALVADADLRAALRAHALATVRRRHTCAHRVDELLGITEALGVDTTTCTMPPRAWCRVASV
jgi:spore maturation protein CgeB